MTTSAPTTTIVDSRSGPNIFLRVVWFLVIGWWLSFAWITLAAIANITIVGIPLGLWMMNRVPQIVTLKMDRTTFITNTDADGITTITVANIGQRPFWQRAAWYVFVGWWLTTIVLYVAWLMCVLVLTIPLAFPLFSATGKLLTLKRG